MDNFNCSQQLPRLWLCIQTCGHIGVCENGNRAADKKVKDKFGATAIAMAITWHEHDNRKLFAKSVRHSINLTYGFFSPTVRKGTRYFLKLESSYIAKYNVFLCKHREIF